MKFIPYQDKDLAEKKEEDEIDYIEIAKHHS
jgi:hypothetical protein